MKNIIDLKTIVIEFKLIIAERKKKVNREMKTKTIVKRGESRMSLKTRHNQQQKMEKWRRVGERFGEENTLIYI